MAAKILDGKGLSEKILNEIRAKVEEGRRKYHSVPGLATILIGDDSASKIYVARKSKVASSLGFHHQDVRFSEKAGLDEVLKAIEAFNGDAKVDGILIQKPLPKRMDFDDIVKAVDWRKDVDGFHPYNVGSLLTKNWSTTKSKDLFNDLLEGVYFPCTPKGIFRLLLEKSLIGESSPEIVIIGASNVVGKPLAFALLQPIFKASVTLCDRGYPLERLKEKARKADILIVAAGSPHLIGGEDIKKGAIVIDVGINRVKDEKTGKTVIVGDVNFEEAKEVASYISPVPGGVGPMTIAMLMENTWMSFKRRVCQ